MKILYIITKSEAGGAQTHISQLTAFMKEKGHDVAVMAHPGGWLEEKTTELGGKFYPNNFFSNSYSPFLGLRAVREIKKAVMDFEPDLASCHSSIAGVWGRWALRRTQQFRSKPAVIFTAHGWAFTEGVSFLRRFIAVRAERLMAKHCKKIICVSEYDRRLALKNKIAPEEKLVTIYNGSDIDRVYFEARNAEKSQLEEKGVTRIVFVGRLSKQKDPELLIEAYTQLVKEGPELKARTSVQFVGAGDKLIDLGNKVVENNLEGSVEFLGSLSRKEVFAVLRGGDIFVLTSNYEGFPRSILEAMSCGLPVIASDVGGVREVVDDEVGYLVERGDGEGVRKSLQELIENLALREEKGRKARERIERDFSLEKMLNTTYDVYEEVLSSKN